MIRLVERDSAMSHPHVDVVKNEWLAGLQHVVARVTIDDAGLVAIDTQDDVWREIVLRGGEPASPDEVRGFLEHLAEAIHGSYLFATGVHDDADCPFRRGLVAPIESVPLEQRQPA